MRILVTNDDGIYAEGLGALKRALEPLGHVTVVAPERPRSAAGHSITLHKPLRLTRVTLPDGSTGWASNGTPTDCVSLAYDVVMKEPADLVVSGINDGPNLGWDLTYSGTVAAAIEGAILGMPAMAVSVAGSQPTSDYSEAARVAVKLAGAVAREGLEPYTVLNVNVPAAPAPEGARIVITHQGRTQYVDRIDERRDPRGLPYYWLAGSLKDEDREPGSDIHTVLRGHVSVTPIHLDLTARHLLDRLRAWNLEP